MAKSMHVDEVRKIHKNNGYAANAALFDPSKGAHNLTMDDVYNWMQSRTGLFGNKKVTGTQLVQDLKRHISDGTKAYIGDIELQNNDLKMLLSDLEHHHSTIEKGFESHLSKSEVKDIARKAYKHLTDAKSALNKHSELLDSGVKSVFNQLDGYTAFHIDEVKKVLKDPRATLGAETKHFLSELGIKANNKLSAESLRDGLNKIQEFRNLRRGEIHELITSNRTNVKEAVELLESHAAKVSKASGEAIPESFLKAGQKLESTAVKAGESAAAHSATTTVEKSGETILQKVHGNTIGRVVSGAASGLLLIDGFRRVFNMGQEPDPNTMTAPANSTGNLVVGVLEAGAGGALLYHNLTHGKGLGK